MFLYVKMITDFMFWICKVYCHGWFCRLGNSSWIQHVPNVVSVLLQMIYAALLPSAQRPWSVWSEMDGVTASVQCPHAQSGATPTTSPLMGLWPTFRYAVFVEDKLLKSQVYSKEGYWC